MDSSNSWRTCWTHLWAWRNTIVVIWTPLLLLPLCFCFEYDQDLSRAMKCAYVILMMIVFWTMESLPLAVTAIFPMVLLPMMSLVKATDLAPQYMAESNMSLVGSIIIIGAFERVGLHELFALKVLTLVGAKPRWLLAGFMLTAWFLSMWCSNTMTTVLLIPTVISVTGELRAALETAMTQPNRSEVASPALDVLQISTTMKTDSVNRENTAPELERNSEHRNYEKMLLLSIAYSASVGGTATAIGTGSNMIMKQQLENAFEDKGCTSPINFLNWLVFAVPMSFCLLALIWLWLLIYFCGPRYAFGCRTSALNDHRYRVEAVVKQIYDKLPPFNFEQGVVLAHCFAMIILLSTREMNSDPLIGWDLIAPRFVKESTATILIAVSLSIFPISLPYKDLATGKIVPPRTSISWPETERSFPFGLLLLIGGGMAAAYGAEKSGLAKLLADLLNDLVAPLDDTQSLLVIVIFMVFMTEFMTNSACVTLMMPILNELAYLRGANPTLFMLPTAIAASFAFMFPVATPSNAAVFQTGKLNIIDIAGAGFVVNLIGIGVLFVATISYGAEYLQLYSAPWILNGTDLTLNKTIYDCRL